MNIRVVSQRRSIQFHDWILIKPNYLAGFGQLSHGWARFAQLLPEDMMVVPIAGQHEVASKTWPSVRHKIIKSFVKK
jgi:hypothetical protein